MARIAHIRGQPVPPGPLLAQESLYVGIDVGKHTHVAGFVSTTLLQRHQRFEGCPVLTFAQSREGFRQVVERMQSYAPLDQCFVLLEKTGHYHHALVQYLTDLDLSVYLMHVRARPTGLLKTDKRDALTLANHLYNQLEKGIQVAEKRQLVRRAIPPTEAATLLRTTVRHRYGLSLEASRRKNKLVAICDELFPEFTQVFKDPNRPAALAIRERFPTPQAVAIATMSALEALRVGPHPSTKQLLQLQALARDSIGVTTVARLRSLVLEQGQLIAELRLLQQHMDQLDTEIARIVEHAREGRILTSIPGIGVIQAATLIAVIGHIDNFASAAALRAYVGWAPQVMQTGTTWDAARLTHGGARTAKQMLFLAVCQAIQQDCEWAHTYQRLVPRKCAFDERTRTYKGKLKVIGHIAGQMIATIYALLKQDAELLRRHAGGAVAPEPQLYDPAIHKAHREGHYAPMRRERERMHGTITALPKIK